MGNMILRGKVVRGLEQGRALGYPTANLDCGSGELPEPGVYAARTACAGVVHASVAIIGAREAGDRPLVEVLLLNFDGDLYGQELTVEVLEKISGIEKFKNNEALFKKIKEDVQKTREFFSAH